ncbi:MULTISPECIES: DUF3894 domain-containing protein [Bacillus cereus group]|uniref:DUF3894 domain-containing protein n=1 Tax=Bacillus cereus TaxID=1396 RepID=A0AA44TD49_BACCE|nr:MULTISPECIES: DUF3894 domain-containing protein [Bacillus cereus group]PFA24242.1 DUF3894 domain-containing protein [Bacillus cereus]PFN09679.1 DUF3894 domain-containing protein [Bacillus cereus]PFO81588.1 DUF3894 domain-containing protein [Bacillus cereus]PFR25504.1 DUF3894 domain-containing protein [Bacillus cereus]PFR96078.1 DUF3894 domain-containing protein [Bacillus cereus]
MYLNPRLSYMQFCIGFLFVFTFILATFSLCSFLISILFMALLNVTFAIGAFQQKHYTSFVMALVMAFSFSIVAIILIIK